PSSAIFLPQRYPVFASKVAVRGKDEVSGSTKADHHFAEMRLALHIPVSLGHRSKIEHPVDYRVNVIDFNGAIHLFEHRPVADKNAMHAAALEHDRMRIGVALEARQHAYHCDLAG